MEPAVTLFSLENDEIKISIDATFEGDVLLIDGYDIGKRVEEYWGDSDYEYSTRVHPDELKKVYALLKVAPGNKMALLKALASRFNTNTCYSEFQTWLEANGIKYEGFSWA